MELKKIATIHTDFPTKFGIPRQSGLIEELQGVVVFEPEYSQPEAFRGLEEFSHVWLIWDFSENHREGFSATVKPPRLEGKRMGVFATRSPFRPNPIGLSCVRLLDIRMNDKKRMELVVSGVDLMDGTPIYDVKPYIAYADAHPDASEGFAATVKHYAMEVDFPEALLEQLPFDKRKAAIAVLSNDPRPAYQREAEGIFKVAFAGYDIHFTVGGQKLVVVDVVKLK